jgi:hypothetical protein
MVIWGLVYYTVLPTLKQIWGTQGHLGITIQKGMWIRNIQAIRMKQAWFKPSEAATMPSLPGNMSSACECWMQYKKYIPWGLCSWTNDGPCALHYKTSFVVRSQCNTIIIIIFIIIIYIYTYVHWNRLYTHSWSITSGEIPFETWNVSLSHPIILRDS